MKPILKLAFYFILSVSNPVSAVVVTDVKTDGTMGAAGSIPVIAGVPTVLQDLGKLSSDGHNLFHSFSTFNIGTGDTVSFTGNPGNSINNVISRVTGLSPSFIDGTLQSTIGNADFYFINPNGVTFGANAMVDVPAAFHVSTANQINFPGEFSATTPSSDVSSFTADPVSFGFLGTNTTGTIGFDGSQITLKDNQTLDVVASNITVANNAKLSVPAGEVRLVATKSNDVEVSLKRLEPPAPDNNLFLPLPSETPTVENAGNIFVDSSAITTQGNGGGRLTLWAGNTKFNQSSFQADNGGDSAAIAGKGINISVRNISADNSSFITSDNVSGTGKAGNININSVDTVYVGTNSWIEADSFAQGDAADVNINASVVTVGGHSDSPNGNFAGIESFTTDSGNGGNVNINAKIVNLVGQGTPDNENVAFAPVIDVDSVGSGYGGDVNIQTSVLNISNVAAITATNHSSAHGGNINIIADDITINGYNNFAVTAITATSYASGNAGKIFVKANNIELLNAGTILGSSYGPSTPNCLGCLGANGANISVDAKHIKIDGQNSSWWTGIMSELVFGSAGKGGDVKVNTETLEILNGGRISSASCNGDCQSIPSFIPTTGVPGNIIINASQRVYLANQSKISTENSAVTLPNPTVVKTGEITISSPDIVLKDSAITTESTGNVDAGDININFSHWLTMDPSFIMTTANVGNGGDIRINGGQLIYLKDSGFLTSVSGATSNGGNIFVNADFLIMDTGVIQANAIGGFGGDVNLHLNGLIASYDNLILGGSWVNWQPFVPGFNVIQAASETGVSGNVTITSPQFNISNITKALDAGSLVLPTINRNPCQNSASNSLKRSGKGGLPINEEKEDFIPAAVVSPAKTGTSPASTPPETSPATTGQSCTGSAI